MTADETVECRLVADVTIETTATTNGRHLDVVVDKPVEKGGTDRGPMPSELWLASLGSCFLMTANRIAKKRRLAFAKLSCTAGAYFEGDRITEATLVVHVDGDATTEAWETVCRLAEKSCTVAQATSAPIEYSIERT